MSSDRTGRWRRFAAAFAALAVGAATAVAVAPAATAADADRTTSVSVTSATAADGLVLSVSGTGYTDLPKTSTNKDAVGIYVALRDPATMTNDAINLDTTIVPAVEFLYGKTTITDGAWAVDLNAAADDLDPNANYEVIVWAAHGGITDDTLLDAKPVTLTNDQKSSLFGSSGGTGEDETSPGSPSTSVSVSSASTNNLVLSVSGSGYASLPNASTGAPAAGVYAALYDSKVDSPANFTQEAQGLAANFAPKTTISAGGDWNTTLTVSSKNLSANGSYRVVTWSAHGLATGSTIIDNVAVTLSSSVLEALGLGAAGGDEQGGTTGASAAVTEVDLAKDRTQTVTASGFTPGETVHGELHSEVVDLGTKVADAGGKVTFTFTVPAGFEVGKHQVVLKGATSGHSVTAAFTVTDSAAATTANTATKSSAAASTRTASVLAESEICTVETVPGTAATPRLSWGVKSSFIAYLGTATAGGTITPGGGAARSGDTFTWGAGSGSLDAGGNGTLTFPGSLHITAHGGVLDLSISNLKVTAQGKKGTLTATIKSQDMQGNPVPVGSVVLADLSFSSLSATGGTATATLTAAGAKAFAGFYQAGEQLDPITVSFAGGSDVTTRTVCRDASGNIVSGAGASVPGLASTGAPVVQLLGLAVLLLLAGAGAVVLAARRREGRTASHL